MPHRFICGLRSAPLIILALCAAAPSSASSVPVVPSILARISGFHGRIVYTGHRSDVSNAPEVQGVAVITDAGFAVDEHAAGYSVHADSNGAVVRSGAIAARSSDPFSADLLINPWPIALAAIARGGLTPRSPTSWEASRDVVVYVDRLGSTIAGMMPARNPRLAFTFADWSDVSGVPLPMRVVRLRSGVQDAAFQIDRLDLYRESLVAQSPQAGSVERASVQPKPLVASGAVQASDLPTDAFPWRLVLSLFGMLALGIAILAWWLRDAFTTRLCARAADDARGWRSSAAAAYVDADGVLWHEGNRYRVGPQFFGRAVEVQHSALLVRVTAPGVSKTVVLPRRLPRLAVRRARTRTAEAGLSLIETLISMAFFTTVIVAGIYPALGVVTRADAVAAEKRAALIAVSNALTDEELACAYGPAAPTGTTITTAGQMTITVTVSDAAIAGARDIHASASDANGRILANLATTVGPPVPPPGSTPPPAGPPSPITPASPAPPGPPAPSMQPVPTASGTPTPPSHDWSGVGYR